MKHSLILLLILCFFNVSCGVKSDIVPPEKPWSIFDQTGVKEKKNRDKKIKLDKEREKENEKKNK